MPAGKHGMVILQRHSGALYCHAHEHSHARYAGLCTHSATHSACTLNPHARTGDAEEDAEACARGRADARGSGGDEQARARRHLSGTRGLGVCHWPRTVQFTLCAWGPDSSPERRWCHGTVTSAATTQEYARMGIQIRRARHAQGAEGLAETGGLGRPFQPREGARCRYQAAGQ